MSLDLTRQNLLTTIFYFVLLAAVFWGEEFFYPPQSAFLSAAQIQDMPAAALPLEQWIDRMLAGTPVAGILLSSLLVFVNSFLVTRLVIRNVIFLERSYLPAIIYLLISSGYGNSYMSFRPLLAAFLMLLALEAVFRSYHLKGLATGAFLVIGFLFGLVASVYLPGLYFVLLLPVALLIFRNFDFREWIAALAGWLFALFLNGYILWMAGGDPAGMFDRCSTVLTTDIVLRPAQVFDGFEWTFLGCVVVLTAMSLVTFFVQRRTYKRQPFKAYSFFIWMLVLLLGMLLFVPCRSFGLLPLLGLPLAVIIPTYFNSRRPNFVSNFLYVLMLGCAVVIHLLPVILG